MYSHLQREFTELQRSHQLLQTRLQQVPLAETLPELLVSYVRIMDEVLGAIFAKASAAQ